MVLLIEDERDFVVQSLYDLLEFREVAFHVAVDGDRAIAFIKENRGEIRLIVLDIMMRPGREFASFDTGGGRRTGLRMLEWLDEHAPEIKVVILTNVSDAIAKGQVAAHKPAVEYFEKAKIDLDQFVGWIHDLTNGRA